MSYVFRCSSCRSVFRMTAKRLGQTIVCPRADCGRRIILPNGGIADPSATPATAPPVRVAAPNSADAVRRSAAQAAVSSVDCRPRRTSLKQGRRQRWSVAFASFVTVVCLGGITLGAYCLARTDDSEVRGWSAIMSRSKTATLGNAESSGRRNRVSRLSDDPQFAVAPIPHPGPTAAADREQRNQERSRRLTETLKPFFAKYCLDCHGADEPMAGIAVHELNSVDQLLRDRKKWERVYRMVNAGAMPPSDHEPFPAEKELADVASFLHEELFEFDCSLVDHPGRPTIHRLNRAEYNNTIRDLFGLSITPADEFPQDDVGEGFDNIGDVLSLPPLLMEKYLDAAERVASAVIDLRDFSKPHTQTIRGPQLTSSLGTKADDAGFVMLQSTGQVTAEIELPEAGEYHVRIEAAADQAGDELAKMGLLIDGTQVVVLETKRRRPQWYEHKLELAAGKQKIAVAFLNDFFDANAADGRKDRNLMVGGIEITGPPGSGIPAWHETHRRFVTVRPDEKVAVVDAARQVLQPILYRAFRRPVSDSEVDRYARLAERQVTEFGESYDYGLAIALQAILVAPDFLFRIEQDPEGSESQRSLNEYEVASRLSYFLWSSAPDDELLKLAEQKKLLDRNELRGQIGRMIRDDRAASLGQNFAAQWLNLRNLRDVRPNPDVFPDFDDALRNAMMRETELFFNAIVREDRSVDDFLLADFTFLNQRLSRHYGIDGVESDEFVRVSLSGRNRSGVLTHASILTLTSNPGRTSPVKRGKWIMENILGEAPPPPPPSVPELEKTAEAQPDLSLRQQLELHRKDPGCASCHKMMDPLGLGLENFDAVGRWRDKDGEKPIDSSGKLPSGESFDGPLELIGVFRARREQFHRALVARIMVYALGRGLEYYDKCAVDKALNLMNDRGYTFSSLVEGVVTSDPFLKRSRTRDAAIATRD